MISNTKRYGNTVNLLKNLILNTVKREGNYGSIVCNKYTEMNGKLYWYDATLRFRVPLKKNVICEECSDGNIYIGIELGEAVCEEYGGDTRIETFISRRAYGHNFREDLVKDLKNDMDVSYEDYEKNPKLIQNSKPYKKIEGVLEDIKNGEIRIEASVKDGEFPKLKNRKLLPVFIINTSTQRIDFFTTDFPDTYRKYRTSRGIDAAWVFTDNFVIKHVGIPKSLVDVKIDCPYIKK